MKFLRTLLSLLWSDGLFESWTDVDRTAATIQKSTFIDPSPSSFAKRFHKVFDKVLIINENTFFNSFLLTFSYDILLLPLRPAIGDKRRLSDLERKKVNFRDYRIRLLRKARLNLLKRFFAISQKYANSANQGCDRSTRTKF